MMFSLPQCAAPRKPTSDSTSKILRNLAACRTLNACCQRYHDQHDRQAADAPGQRGEALRPPPRRDWPESSGLNLNGTRRAQELAMPSVRAVGEIGTSSGGGAVPRIQSPSKRVTPNQ